MILEAFSKYLRQANPQLHATEVLGLWLTERLLSENNKDNSIDRVIQCEITVDCLDSESIKTPVDDVDLNKNHPLPVPKENLAQIACLESISTNTSQNPTTYVFIGKSQSGERLLKSLVEYCLSIEHQKWARFVHSLKASDFKQID